MQKNVKGFISLGCAIGAVACFVLGLIPMSSNAVFNPFWGDINTVFGIISYCLCAAAIVFAILSFRDKDKKGPRKTGMIISIVCILFAWLPLLFGFFGSSVNAYLNGNNDNFVAEAMNDYQAGKKDSWLKKNIDSIENKEDQANAKEYLEKMIAEHNKHI